MSLFSINSLHLIVSEIWARQDVKGQSHYGKVKSRSHHDVAHLHHPTNVPTTYQLLTHYGFQDIPLTTFLRSWLLQQGQRSMKATPRHYTPKPLTNISTKCQPSRGGLNMIDITHFISALKITWARRLYVNAETPWASLAKHYLGMINKMVLLGMLKVLLSNQIINFGLM